MTDQPKTDCLGAAVRAFQAAMQAEGIDEVRVDHVVNRVLYGDPHPFRRREADEVVPPAKVVVQVSRFEGARPVTAAWQQMVRDTINSAARTGRYLR